MKKGFGWGLFSFSFLSILFSNYVLYNGQQVNLPAKGAMRRHTSTEFRSKKDTRAYQGITLNLRRRYPELSTELLLNLLLRPRPTSANRHRRYMSLYDPTQFVVKKTTFNQVYSVPRLSGRQIENRKLEEKSRYSFIISIPEMCPAARTIKYRSLRQVSSKRPVETISERKGTQIHRKKRTQSYMLKIQLF